MSVWEEIARYKLPVVCLHQHSGQPEGCLEGLVHYAAKIACNKHTYAFRTPYQIVSWLWQQPVKLDVGDGPSTPGCVPAQRSRIWPDDGLNCWEAVAHLLAVAFVNQWMIEFHIFDAKVGSMRHVFPAVRPLWCFEDMPEPLVIQPPVKTGATSTGFKILAQAWYNDLLGGVHIVGDKVLRVYGMGDFADSLAGVEGDQLPDWARTAKQKEQRASDLIKKSIAQTSNMTNAKTAEEASKPTSTGTTSIDLETLKKQMDQLAAENAALKAKLQKGA